MIPGVFSIMRADIFFRHNTFLVRGRGIDYFKYIPGPRRKDSPLLVFLKIKISLKNKLFIKVFSSLHHENGIVKMHSNFEHIIPHLWCNN